MDTEAQGVGVGLARGSMGAAGQGKGYLVEEERQLGAEWEPEARNFCLLSDLVAQSAFQRVI